ncbi:MAG: hypothetical protein JXD23_01935 [Spirochaetales bacterium]|nr:hypothetical protein [Spirochaetales bacterium]
MKRALLLALPALLLSAPALSAQDFSYSGNVRIDSAWHHAALPVADPALPWYGLTDWQTAFVLAEADLRLTTPSAEIRVHQDLAFDEEASFRYRLFEGYASFSPAGWFTVTIGKRHLSLGTSYFFFPADRLNPVVLDPSDGHRDYGFPGLTLTLAPSADFTLTASLSFEDSLARLRDEFFRDFRYALAASLVLGPLNLKADVIYEIDRVFRPGGGFTLDLGGFIFFGEAAVELNNRTLYPTSPATWEERPLLTPFPYFDGGVRRNFTAGDFTLFAVAEYFFTGAGFTPDEEDRFFQAAPLGLAVAPEHLGRHYALFSISMAVENLFSFENAGVWNAQDGSWFFWHKIVLQKIENLDLYCEVVWTAGASETEFAAAPERLRLSAGAVYYF